VPEVARGGVSSYLFHFCNLIHSGIYAINLLYLLILPRLVEFSSDDFCNTSRGLLEDMIS